MKVEVEQVATCVRRLTVEVPSERVNRELEALYRDLQRRVRVPGFRQGKVPRQLLERHYRQSVEQEVLQKLVPEALSEALIKESLRAVGDPQIDQMTLTKDQPLRFVATTQIIPPFELADYHSWQFERHIPAVKDADMAAALARIRERHAALQAVSGRPVQAGDFVIIDYQGFLDERPLHGGEGTGLTVEVGAGAFLPEIERGLVGLEQGAEKAIAVRFPDDHRDRVLAGQEVQFRVRVNEIKEKILPTLDDEFARANEDAESLEALQSRVRGELEEAARRGADEVLRREILARLVAANAIDVPEILVNEQMLRTYLHQKRQELGRELTEEDMQHIDLDGLRETLQEPALEAVRGQLILRRIGDDAGVTVTPEEVNAEVASLAARMAQNPEALKKAMERNGSLGTLEASLYERKIFEIIFANVQVADKIEDEATASPAH
jgi:trigger factor